MSEKIARAILYLMVTIPMTVAAFAVSPFMGVPFLCMLVLGGFRVSKYDL